MKSSTPYVPRDFYRPHARVHPSTTLLNPFTGALEAPVCRVKQEFKAECDINNIIKLYKQTGQITHMRAQAAQGSYIDLPDASDFQESLHLVMQAEASFATLPAKVRDRFGNDPALFLGFMADPNNKDEIISMGLTNPAPTPAPVPINPAPPPTPPPSPEPTTKG
ncbi:internal scaffolding protein [robinz microvirus RP_104]|nr:internal scaffolding protein [robinz microvirus RP_104]